jgi:hypothetical protein
VTHDEDPPELRDYVPSDGRPLRHPLTLRVMRLTIVLGILGLVVPGLVATIALQARTAGALCDLATRDLEAVGVVRFELLGPAGPSWYCYARGFGGQETLLGSLGLIPG